MPSVDRCRSKCTCACDRSACVRARADTRRARQCLGHRAASCGGQRARSADRYARMRVYVYGGNTARPRHRLRMQLIQSEATVIDTHSDFIMAIHHHQSSSSPWPLSYAIFRDFFFEIWVCDKMRNSAKFSRNLGAGPRYGSAHKSPHWCSVVRS